MHKTIPMHGVHERLTKIMHEVIGTDLGHTFDGQFFLSKGDRETVRKRAANLIKLMDEYDMLDRID